MIPSKETSQSFRCLITVIGTTLNSYKTRYTEILCKYVFNFYPSKLLTIIKADLISKSWKIPATFVRNCDLIIRAPVRRPPLAPLRSGNRDKQSKAAGKKYAFRNHYILWGLFNCLTEMHAFEQGIAFNLSFPSATFVYAYN